jgi:hypothetical protein
VACPLLLESAGDLGDLLRDGNLGFVHLPIPIKTHRASPARP